MRVDANSWYFSPDYGQLCLVIAPKGLATQWVAEMHTHFNEDFPSQGQGTGSLGKE